MLAGMNRILSARVLILLSIAYGITVALVAAFGGPVSPVAIVGALVIGALWAVHGAMRSRAR